MPKIIFFKLKKSIILPHYFYHDNKADKSDLTKCGMKIGAVQDLQELPYTIGKLDVSYF